jgi:N-acetylmuramoyl-L-alanine amidase
MRPSAYRRLQRIFNVVRFTAILIVLLIVGRAAGYALPGLGHLVQEGEWFPARGHHVALISGHAGYDSGAVCTDEDGQITLTEADINARITNLVAQRLRRAGADVVILDEHDGRLDGLEADVLLSLHADSCIDATGYKAARSQQSRIPATEDRLLACISRHYPAVTGLTHHPNTVTHDMTQYYAFRQVAPETPAAILEMGFLGGDRSLLADQPEVAAKGITDSILCFLTEEPAG